MSIASEQTCQIIEDFLDYLWQENGLSDNTINSYRFDLQQFHSWLKKPKNLIDANENDLQEFLYHRFNLGFKASSNARLLSCLKKFYRFLNLNKYRADDPSLNLKSPKIAKNLPKSLSEEQVEALLNAPNIKDPIGLRDKAMLELLYATGLRVSELVSLTLNNINLSQGLIRVFGKGNKERIIPMGAEANHWLQEFFNFARKNLLGNKQSDILFPSSRNLQMTRQTFWHRIKHYAVLSDIDTSKLSPHTLRHAFATHLVDHGADLRVVQMLLGHSDLSTTQIYTHIAKARLKSLHKEFHPRG